MVSSIFLWVLVVCLICIYSIVREFKYLSFRSKLVKEKYEMKEKVEELEKELAEKNSIIHMLYEQKKEDNLFFSSEFGYYKAEIKALEDKIKELESKKDSESVKQEDAVEEIR